ncbi:MAG: serine/threonine-protein kinase [Vicinamibacterales bacterium]
MLPPAGREPTVARDADRTRPDAGAVRRVAPRLPTPPPVEPDRSGDTLPDDLLAEQLQRLTAFALVAGGLWGIGLVMDAVVFPLAIGAPVRPTSLAINTLGVLGAVGTYVWVRFSKRAPRAKSDAGMWLMLLNAFDIALLETWAVDPTHAMLGHLSWTAIVILLSAMIVPSSPRKMLAFGLAAASMSPIGVWLAHLRGVDTPSAFHTLLMYFPTYSCALAAVVPARMFQRVGRRLREARDLGSYELVERLGEGGMGEVWRARHRLLARPAAIKLVRPAMLAGGADGDARLAIKRFEAEAQSTAALTSPHTIRLFDFGATDDGRFYYVMELLEGRDMASLVEQSGPLPAARAVYLLRQICHSLAEAHSQGMVHRDIKPANIFVCRMGLDDDVVKVLDFGLVQKARRDPAQDLTSSLASMASLAGVAGTPAFMAPELVADPDRVDHRADIYALGCVAHYLLTGEHVFHGRTPLQALLDHVSAPPQRASARAAADVPGWLDDLILACLAKDPADRPPTAAAVAQRIAMLEGTPGWTAAKAREWWQARRAVAVSP